MFAHKNLSLWQGSMEMVVKSYSVTAGFPKSEIFGLSNQVRRAAVSIPANISEGAARGTPKEFVRFLRISFGSLSELDTLFEIAFRLGYLSTNTYKDLQGEMKKISAQISGLIRSLDKKQYTLPP
jgi:four helix bundle protein